MSIDSYVMDKRNVFDPAIDKLINQLNDQIAERQKYIDGWEELQKNDPDRYRELAEQAGRYEIDIEDSQVDAWMDISYYEDQLLAVGEMKILYAFKFLEINIKRLIKAYLTEKSVRSFFNWENLIGFLKDHNINAKQFKSFEAIDQLRKVNNTLKHSDEDFSQINKIPEFEGINHLYYSDLERFYKRIKDAPDLFLKELAKAIYEERYFFDDKKLDDISDHLALRLDEKDAEKLIEKLKLRYSNDR